ncbi:MAG: hypothetical protein J7498_11215 [Sphingobium sp.]|nr:hypothetical protein [Sphingobium sp.]
MIDKPKKPFTWERGPFLKCLKCQEAEGLGILSAGGDTLRWRCTKCRYGYSEILPELDKKVIYLDQFGFSELHKLRARTRREDKHTAFWSKVSDLINEAVLLQQLILPYSNIHHDETIVSPFAEALRDTQEHIGGDISFISTNEIQLDQMEVFAEAFASGAEPSLEFDVDDILDDERNEWLNDIRISVPFDWSGFAPETREQRDKTGLAISELIDCWIAKGMGFDDVLNQELNAYHESRLEGLREAQRRFEKGLENYDLMAMAELFHGSAFRELQYVRELFREAGVPDAELTARVRAFWDWDGNKEQPNGKILAYMLAALADQFTHGRKRKPSAGFLNDVSAIASYAPYVDAMFVDIECAQLLQDKRCLEALKYRAKIFSLNSGEEFIAYLQAIIDETPDDVRRYASIIYGI